MRIVVKIGTSTLAHGTGHLNIRRVEEICKILSDIKNSGQEVIVVDDVITTGGSTLKAIGAIEAEGGKVVAALVLVDRQEGGREAIESRGIPVFPMFTRATIFGGK